MVRRFGCDGSCKKQGKVVAVSALDSKGTPDAHRAGDSAGRVHRHPVLPTPVSVERSLEVPILALVTRSLPMASIIK